MNLGFPPWVHQAACLGMDPNLFFPERGDAEATCRAKAVCRSCSVRALCLNWALSIPHSMDAGVLGGTSERERRRIRVERGMRRTG